MQESALLPSGVRQFASVEDEMPTRGSGRRSILIWTVAIAFALRLAVIFALHTYALQTQSFAYKWIPVANNHFFFGYETGSIAGSLARGQGFSSPFVIATGPTAWIAPAYPVMCATVFKLFGLYSTASAIVILSLNSLFAALTCIPIYLISLRIFDARVAALSAWIWAVCPFFMRWPTTWVWEVSLSAWLLSILVLLSLSSVESEGKRPWIALGLLWGLAAITNPSLLGAMPFSLAWIAMRRKRSLRTYFKPISIVILICVAIMLPWMIRNRMAMGQFVFVRDNFGFEFYLGNYHGSNGLGFLGRHPSQNPQQMQNFSRWGELRFVRHFGKEGLKFVRQYPEEFALLTARRLVTFWDGGMINFEIQQFWNWQPWELLMLSVPAAFGLALALFRRRSGTVLLGLVVILYPAPYYLTYAQERYRHAIEPELLILACFFAFALWDHLRRRFAPAYPGQLVPGEWES